jgi:hypothetical protein
MMVAGMNRDYAQRVVEGVRDYLSDDGHDYVKDVRLAGRHPQTAVVITFFARQTGEDRDLELGIYHPAFNSTGEDDPQAVGNLIGIHVEEEAEASKDPVEPRVADEIIRRYTEDEDGP